MFSERVHLQSEHSPVWETSESMVTKKTQRHLIFIHEQIHYSGYENTQASILRECILSFLHLKQVLKGQVQTICLSIPRMPVPHTLFRQRMCVRLMFHADSCHAYDMLNMSFRCHQPSPSMLCHCQTPVLLGILRGLQGEVESGG